MADLKATTMRLSEETIKNFREVAEKEGITQEQCMASLLQVFEMQQAKSTLKDRKREIETFEEYVSRLQNLYLASLEMNVTAEEKISKELSEKLNEKNEVILSLNKEINNLKNQISEIKETNKRLEESLKEKDSVTKSTEELNAQNKFLLNQVNKENELLYSKIDELKSLEDKFSSLSLENKKLNGDFSTLSSKLTEKDIYISSLLDKISFLESNLEHSTSDIKAIRLEHKEEIQNISKVHNLDKENSLKQQKENLQEYYSRKIEMEIEHIKLIKDTEIKNLQDKLEGFKNNK
ncbi:hypothetical protein [Clostridium sp. 'White wine YQ']|uniref:hypothetical protein n=1 Tax=Clostridium sp. 'White wine YQ' TaxID=3027474 RepID=UPI002366798A|nr:hypothetical protein [Clostridium sp. 'White wine YQ']MDD7793835.1 hypothetical protein [Clostridium sp. 'White wine YQ']